MVSRWCLGSASMALWWCLCSFHADTRCSLCLGRILAALSGWLCPGGVSQRGAKILRVFSRLVMCEFQRFHPSVMLTIMIADDEDDDEDDDDDGDSM